MTIPTSTALITGASSGIGKAIARQLAAHGANLILVARNERKLQALAEDLTRQYGIRAQVIATDLSHPDAGKLLQDELAVRGLHVDLLVNNAGFGGFSEFARQDQAEIGEMIAVNVTALTDLTRRFLPTMLERGRGRVLNVASTAGFIPGPLMAVYYATKAYVLSFSEAVNEELRGSGLSVTALCPGPVDTGFQDAATLNESKLMTGVTRLAMLDVETVARIGVEAMLRGQGVAVAGLANKVQVSAFRLLPRAAAARIIAGVQARREE
ncbi:SDR family NAD(P)-dependent oxidoreductase [Deinococcus marmoris]|uniref:3-oxoacyl-[acyl-carrier protein] reductase n=1 Tax=Deinococcus marmoris TaxID=249408 RepID=A0A1U7NRU6_9DEIO|nr:SDR family oxidoreductase [Deinococcus marmoris]OLV15642.1 3-oxoacyl-[acyl-carrier protein] reductase [Deinococcus marmoris]